LAERPHEEEKAHASLCVENGMVTPVTSSRGGMTSPPQKKCRREPKLQGLPEIASTSSRHPRLPPDHLLATTAGQVVRRRRREAEEVEAALGEEIRVAHAPAHQISTPLATEADRRRRKR
jgi:hypothetical protein